MRRNRSDGTMEERRDAIIRAHCAGKTVWQIHKELGFDGRFIDATIKAFRRDAEAVLAEFRARMAPNA